MKDTLILILVLAVLGASFFLGRQSKSEGEVIKRDTITIVKTDTLRFTEIKPVKIRIKDTIYIPISDTLTIRDTTYMILPREEKVYQDSTFRAVVSGFRPSLDTIDVYQKTIYKNIYQTEKAKKYGIGVIGGLGYSDKIRPFIGIGVYYKLF